MKLENYIALAKYLGWGQMLPAIAMPAIDEIMKNFLTLAGALGYGASSEDDAIDYIIKSSTGDDVFCFLLGEEPVWANIEDHENFIVLREKIEYEMLHGVDYKNAIAKWYKDESKLDIKVLDGGSPAPTTFDEYVALNCD